MSLQFVCCKMAKQKRKESEVAEKKSKKLKKVSAVEMPVACAVPPGTGTAPAEVGEVGTLAWEGTWWSRGWCPGGQSPADMHSTDAAVG